MEEERLIDGGFITLNNGYWIFKDADPNNCQWFTIGEALKCLDTMNTSHLITKLIANNKVDTIEEAMTYLTQKYQYSNNLSSKCIKLLIDHIKSEKHYDSNLLLTFLSDLKYCSSDDDGNINLHEDAEFYVNSFIESSDYEVFKEKMKNN